MKISGKTRVCGVIGDPIEHSLSPAIQNAAFEQLKLDYVFLAFKVKAGEAENAMHGIRCLGIHGINVTMPHKNAVIAHLDKVDETTKFLGSVNTILNDNGKLCGFSTDGIGAVNALKENGVKLSGKKLVLLGAGGAAKAIASAFAKEVREIILLNRTSEKAKELTEALSKRFGKKIAGERLTPKALQKHLEGTDVLINATSVGMHPQAGQSLVAPQWLKPSLTIMDIVYDPLETKLAKDAKAAGARVVSGVEMLIYQGAASFEVWTGYKAPIEVMRKAALSQLSMVGSER